MNLNLGSIKCELNEKPNHRATVELDTVHLTLVPQRRPLAALTVSLPPFLISFFPVSLSGEYIKYLKRDLGGICWTE